MKNKKKYYTVWFSFNDRAYIGGYSEKDICFMEQRLKLLTDDWQQNNKEKFEIVFSKIFPFVYSFETEDKALEACGVDMWKTMQRKHKEIYKTFLKLISNQNEIDIALEKIKEGINLSHQALSIRTYTH